MKRRRFDSDDDEDEYLAAAEVPLSMYATLAGEHNDRMLDMGLASSESSRSRASSERSTEGRAQGALTEAVDVPGPSAAEPRGPAVHLSSQTRSDQDVADELLGLLSDALLAVYQTPLLYAQSRRPVDDKLLAQYQPHRHQGVYYGPLPGLDSDSEGEDDGDGAEGGGGLQKSWVATRAYRNPYGIAPGWRWDGVVRGRKQR